MIFGFRSLSPITKMCRRFRRADRILCILLSAAFLLAGCQKKELLPQPEFPLSEAALAAALEETGLSWSIKETYTNTDGKDIGIGYSLHRPGDRASYYGVYINSYDTEALGRRLQIYFREPQNKQWWQDETEACWEDWQQTLELAARLYGGFEDAGEIYRACSAGELPKDQTVLWEGTLTGGYFHMTTSNHMKPDRLALGNNVTLNVYESEEHYLRFQQMAEEIQKRNKPSKNLPRQSMRGRFFLLANPFQVFHQVGQRPIHTVPGHMVA